MSASVECGRCKGTGRRPLGRPLSEALDAVGVEWMTTSDLVAVANHDINLEIQRISATTMLARLDKLLVLGLIERRSQNRRTYEWRLAQ